jgi:hypothetical protein
MYKILCSSSDTETPVTPAELLHQRYHSVLKGFSLSLLWVRRPYLNLEVNLYWLSDAFQISQHYRAGSHFYLV